MTEDVKRRDSTSLRLAPPSGAWLGYFLDGESGQPLHQVLTLNFTDGRIHGDGDDCNGPFFIYGEYSAESGVATWVNRYHGSSAVHCRGFHERGSIWGVWRGSSDLGGGLQVWPMTGDDGSKLTTREQIDMAASAMSKALSRFAGRSRGVAAAGSRRVVQAA